MNHSAASARAVALAVAAALATPGLAAAADPADSNALEEVVVTAQFREQRLQDTPIAISAMSADMLEARGMLDIASAANLAPNVSLARGPGSFGQMASVFIRGVGQADPHFAVEPGVGMFLDDVYYGVMTGAIFQLLDTDRVEVLRGPQGTLAGKNAIGGAIKLYSKRPGPESDGFAEVTYGSFNRVQGRAGGNVTLLDDKLWARFTVAGRHVDGYVDRIDYGCATRTGSVSRAYGTGCKLGTQGGEDVWSARGALLFKPTDNVENLLSFDIIRDTSENPPSQQQVQSPLWAGSANYVTPRGSYFNYEDNRSTPSDLLPGTFPPGTFRNQPFAMSNQTPLTGTGISNNLTVRFDNDLTLTSITAYRNSDVSFTSLLDASPASIIDQIWRLQHSQFTQEFRLNGSAGTLVDWTAGLFWYKADGTSGGRIVIPAGLAPGGGGLGFDIFFRDPVDTESRAAFLHSVWHVGEQTNLTVGGRYTKDTKDFTFNRLDINGAPYFILPGLVDFTSSFSGNQFDYRVGLDHRFSDEFMAYAQVSTGYKGGGVNPRPFFSTQAVPYDPEELTAYEVGFKKQFLDRRGSFNVAAFQNDYTGFQATLLSCPSLSPAPGAPCAQSTNVGDARIRGLEAEIAFRGDSGLQLDVSAGWLDFAYQKVRAETGITRSMTNIYTPEFTSAVGVGYQFAAGSNGTITPRLDWSYRSEMQSESINSAATTIESRGLLDLRVIWANPGAGWEATMAVNNLTDRFYFDSQFGRFTAPYFSATGRPGRPREVMLTVRRNFD